MNTLHEFIKNAVDPAFKLLPAGMDSKEARVLLLAIGLQESRFTARRQLVGSPPKPTGPAKSFYQGERFGGMVHGVRVHKVTKDIAAKLYQWRAVPANNQAIWDAIEYDDVLATALARLLLYTDPFRLPKFDDVGGAWETYLRTWRPGRPHRATWNALHSKARAAVESYTA